MPILTKISILFSSLLIILLQGCGNNDSSTDYPTTLSTGVSIETTEQGAIMLPNSTTTNNISKEISDILKTNILNYNAKEAIDFNKETNYCDISGLKESHNSGNMQKINSEQNYANCQETQNHQHGKINIDYSQVNLEGKYPQLLDLSISEAYTFNTLNLKKALTVNSNIIYNDDKSIKTITLSINGTVNYNNINYALNNIKQSINYQ
ncbi:MAG: Unknown protein [uncultured Sulfurovum sp.]|uniref:Uncharacterized protein n=1 Tax=uncultured Sulfurovum sp. TaxID=269237 RepID=A0A6S6SX15_9BACT|nr:MAG: Unknown protein [uncultured Sulfurovum sp.]